jgi:3-isopropylmalate dehydrogenase
MYKIAVIGGDGTGPEVVTESIKVLNKVAQQFQINFSFTHLNYNGTRYLKEGITLTNKELAHLKTYDAILLGAIGHTDVKPGILEKEILLKIRFELDQYINLRPVKLYENVATPLKNKSPQDINYVIIRENVGGLYTGLGSFENKNTPQETAIQSMVYTRHQVERCLRYAFAYALERHQEKPFSGLSKQEIAQGYLGKLTLVGKTNVLTYVFDLWQRTFKEVAQDYPQILPAYCHVDAACIYMLEIPEQFDVLVTTNMFGDIITDLAAVTQGGMGVAPGANINPQGVSMFEPIGGTAPTFTGQNKINPLASIGSAALMLKHLGLPKAGQAIETAINQTTKKMKSMAAGKMGFTTTEIGDLVCSQL